MDSLSFLFCTSLTVNCKQIHFPEASAKMDPNNRTSAIEDDDNSWIPLSPSASCDTHHEPQPSRHDNPGYRTSSNKSTNQNNSGSTRLPHVGTNDRTKSLQQRLETRMSLKSNLVDHPIDLFWKRYLLNLAREVWALEWHIRLGFCMVLSGIAIKLFLFSTWYFWYPRFVFGTVAMGAATIYLDFFHLRRHVDAVGKALLNPENIWTYLQQLDSTGSRRLTLVILLIPTALEMRTLSFLSGIKAETGWIIYNIVLSCTLLGLMMFWFRVKNIMPRECLYRGLLVLYGSALWITIYKTDLARMPVLAAPFLTATGTILITYQDDDMEWVSRILRHALRLTLRDVLSSMGEKVSEDEMLQLAILRWLADYWASIPADSPPESFTERPSTAPASTVPGHTSTPASSTSTDSISNQTSQEPARSQVTRTSSSTTSRPSTSAILQRRHEVSWQELLPMLNVATDHMTTEVQMLQANSQTRSSGETSTSSGSSADPIESFHDMLRTLNVDERAEPAVRAYKRGVASFPPSQETAVLLSIVRRSPALLTIVWQVIVLKPGLFSSTMVLLPFVVMEYYRIIAWIHCCEQVKVFFESAESLEPHPKYIPSSLKDVDPMVIMLVGDSYNALRPPALLLVWQNVLNSVSALEVGLTAARCAETTAVAVQFAGNVLSLVQFGQEIHQHGLLHGLILMGKEAILYHTSDASIRHQEATKYTHAVMGAMDNAQKVARNIQTLANDEKIGHFIQPVVLVVCTLSGYGWLWGNETPTNEEGMDDTKQHAPTNGETVSIGKDILQDQCLRGNAMDAKDATPTSVPQELDRLSDLMDEIVDSYGRGQISQVCGTMSMSVYL